MITMTVQYRLALLTLLLGLVRSQGFGGYDKDDDQEDLRADGDREDGGKRNPFDQQDEAFSPQQSLNNRITSTDADSFTEKLPVGTLKFGDTLLSSKQATRLFHRPDGIGQAIVNDKKLRWPDAVIPYEIDCSLVNLKDAMAAIEAGMKEWESKTCIRFVERKDEEIYLRFFRDTQCWGHVGRHSYASISVGYGCEKKNIMAHEIGHAIGFYHEQNRKDRDDHVKINFKKIGDAHDAFRKVKNAYSHNVGYDYASIMHYPWHAFSIDGSNTMDPKRKTQEIPYREVSEKDIEQTRLMYNCTEVEKKWKRLEHQAKRSTPQRAPMIRPDNPDEYSIFFSIQQDAGEPGCVDWSDSCADWAGSGYCQTQEIVRTYCKKTCREPICTASECKDRHPKCKYYGKFCKHENYKTWMNENCCKFCNNNMRPKCRDTKRFCKDYSKLGYCTSSKNFREIYCCKTCKDKDVEKTCVEDVNKQCKTLKRQGYCKSYKKFMERQCCVTCRDAGGIKPIEKKKVNPPKCSKDVRLDCSVLKLRGQCKRRKSEMKKDCCVTCRGTICGKQLKKSPVQPLNNPYPIFLGTGKLCKNVRDWNPNKCPEWANIGWCKSKEKEMNLWCRKSCKLCDDVGLHPPGVCNKPLGLSDGGNNKIPDSSFTSAQPHLAIGRLPNRWNAGPENARLYFEDDYINKRIGGWCSKTGKSTMEKLESITVDLGRKKRITHIATQGRDKYFERVSKFKIEYSNTGEDDDFCPYLEDGVEKIFEGNCDHVTPVLNKFWTPLEAQFMKFIPWRYNYPCVRMEFYGCDVTERQPEP